MTDSIHSATACEIVDVNRKTGVVTHTITTGGVNLNGHDVVQEGIDLSEFTKGGIVLFNHDDMLPAIGKNVGLMHERANNRWVADTEFAKTQFGTELLYLYENRFMRSWSIGFRPVEQEAVKDSKGRIEYIRFPKTMLKEYSAVTLAANVDAVTHAVTDNHIRPATLRLLSSLHQLMPESTRSEADLLGPALTKLKARREELAQWASRHLEE